MLPHRLFPNARYSIWVDSKSQFRRDPLGVLEALLWRSNHELAISEHGARSSVYDEAKAVVKKNKATPEEVEVQLAQYRRDGLPEDKRFNGKKGIMFLDLIYSITVLIMGNTVIVSKHDEINFTTETLTNEFTYNCTLCINVNLSFKNMIVSAKR